jgi:hypothetical protein
MEGMNTVTWLFITLLLLVLQWFPPGWC